MDIEIRRDSTEGRTYEGLIGNADRDYRNDLQIRHGPLQHLPRTPEVIAQVGASWLVTPEETLFKKFPSTLKQPASAKEPELVVIEPENANEKCTEAGITDALALRHCVYDVVATGDETFIESAKVFQQAVIAMPPEDRAQETIDPVEPLALLPAPTSDGGVGLLLSGEAMDRDMHYGMNGHYLTFQKDGNLCLYRTEGDQFVWCMNNDPSVEYQRSAKAQLTREGQLLVTDEVGQAIWQVPASEPVKGTGIFITTEGVLQMRAPSGAVMWSSHE